jgi:photosystem II stability/assembly factor-like uncharacterized protein
MQLIFRKRGYKMKKKMKKMKLTCLIRILWIIHLIILINPAVQAQEYMQQTKGPEGIYAREIAVNPTNGYLYLCAEDGSYYLSRDQGANWIFKSKRDTYSEPMIVTSWGTVFIGESRIYKSDDQASTWQEANSGMPSSVTIFSMLFDPDSGEIYAGTDQRGVYVSSDSGATWVARNNGLTDYLTTRINSLYRHSNGEIYATSTNYSNGHIFRWDSSGQQWMDLSGPITGVRSFTDLAITSDNRIFVTTWSGLLYRSDDNGNAWADYSSGIGDPYISCITALPGNILLAGTLYNGAFRSEDLGASWLPLRGTGLYGSDVWDMTYDYTNGFSYISIRNAGIFRSDATGNLWQAMNNGLRHVSVNDIMITADNAVYAASSGAGIYRSDDQGNTWEWIAADIARQSVIALAYKPGFLFAGTQVDGVYISGDGGDSWSRTGLTTSPGWITAMEVGPDGSIFAGNNAGNLHRSIDNGVNWDDVADFEGHIFDITYNSYSGHLFVGVDNPSYGGVYRSTDGGAVWTRESKNLGSVRVHSVASLPGDSTVYAATVDDGVYISSGSLENMSWYKPASIGLENWVETVIVNSKGEIFAGSNFLYHSRDGGLSYQVASHEPASTGFMAMALDRSEVLYIGTDGKSVWRSTNPTTARNIKFSVKMKYEDGFDPSTQQVVVLGAFNDWGIGDDWILTAQDDEDMTYEGLFTLTNVGILLTDNQLEYKYAIPPDRPELFSGNRVVEWSGAEDLNLEPVWFSNQKEFSRMKTSGLSGDLTDSRGAAWADINDDGYDDLIVTEAGSGSRNDLYLNDGAGKFTKLTSGPVGSDIADSRAATWGDFNNDGYIDLFVTNQGTANFLYKNDGAGTFVAVSDVAISGDTGNSVCAVWADFDNDGWIDLFVANNSGENNFLYMNNGSESFTKVSGENIVTDGGDSRGCAAADYNNDGWIDLFVANALPGGENNFLYLNNHSGGFTRVTSGPVVEDQDESFGGSWGDYNNDGWLDLYVTNNTGQFNRLYQNDGTGNFTSVVSTQVPDLPFSASLGSAWADFDNDGWLDLYVSTFADQANMFFRNKENGGFERQLIGPLVQDIVRESRGTAWSDYDNDGDPDLFVANSLASNALYRNNLAASNWLKIKLRGTISNKSAIGATVVVRTRLTKEDGRTLIQRRTIEGQSGFMGQNSQSLLFGLRQETSVDSIIIYWPKGLINKYSAVAANQTLTYQEFDPVTTPAKVTLNAPQDQSTDIALPPGLAWNAAAGATRYHLQVATDISFSSLLVDESTLSNTVFTIPGAAYNQIYYWRVQAGNTSLWGPWSDIWKFTTVTSSAGEKPPAPVLVSPTDGETGVQINPSFSWNPAGDASQYHLIVSETNVFTLIVGIVEDSLIDGTSKTLSGLQYDKTYYWKVRAKNSAGWGPWSAIRSFSTLHFSGTPNPPTLVGPVDGQTGVPIPAPLVWNSEVSGQYQVEMATDIGFNNIIFSQSDISERYIFVGGLNFNQQYFWHVRVNANEIDSNWSTIWSLNTYDDKIEVIGKVISFPSHERRDEFSATDYRMVGLPGNANLPLSDLLGTDAGETWMAYWDNGKTGNQDVYLVAFDGTDVFRFTAGKGFWLIHNGNIIINRSLTIASLNLQAQAEILLHLGWNIITCPFDHNISWLAVKTVNDLSPANPLIRFNSSNQSYESHDQLEPLEGFYFYNGDAGRTVLLIPYIDGIGKVSVQSDLTWEASLEISSGKTIDKLAIIGVAPDAKPGLDHYEFRKPRSFADLASVYFERPEWDAAYPQFANDIRPEIEGIGSWEFKVYAPQNQPAKLSLIGLEKIPEIFEVYLIDHTHQCYQDLRQTDLYEFNSMPEICDFELLVGETDVVNEKIRSILPAEFMLGQNYPNPFNPLTTIPLTLPENSEITVNVYNLLGQEILTLFKGELNAGKHYLVWDGKNSYRQQMPSGVYIYQMRVQNGERFTGKMVLIK